jgi:hypothetical protein
MSMSKPMLVSDTPHNVLALDDKKYSRLGWWLVLGGFVGFIGWAALAPLDKGVAVSGKVMVSGHRKTVQHPAGGIVERIDVRDGDVVSAGQVLLRLKETPLRGQMQSLRSQYLASLASEARLSAESEGLPAITFGPELLNDPEAAGTLNLQRQLFSSRAQALATEQQGLRQADDDPGRGRTHQAIGQFKFSRSVRACRWKPSSRPASARCSTTCSNPCWIALTWPWWKNAPALPPATARLGARCPSAAGRA